MIAKDSFDQTPEINTPGATQRQGRMGAAGEQDSGKRREIQLLKT